MQASLYGLYDSTRSRSIRNGSEPWTWDAFLADVANVREQFLAREVAAWASSPPEHIAHAAASFGRILPLNAGAEVLSRLTRAQNIRADRNCGL